jgi:hypothetical protein
MQSWWFLLWTSVCCGLVVAFATWAAGGSSGAVRVVAALVGLAAGLGVMLLVAWALTPEEPSPVPEAPTAVSPPPEPVSEPPEPATTDRGPLTEQLEEGRALRAELDTGASDARVDAWIAGVRGALERQRPGVAGYFGALAGRAYADDPEKLDAHIARLATIVHEFL